MTPLQRSTRDLYATLALLAALGALLVAALIGEARSREARPVQLLGQCGGVIMAAMEESDFPAGCAWIEPINYYSEYES